MIPEEVIEQVRQATDIVQVIGQYLRLKKRGRNHVALCPFHTEKTPSFNVNEDRQIFHCFGCGKGGNVFGFLMEHEQMSFVEAVKFLAKRANIVIPEDRRDDRQRHQYEKISYANQLAMEYFEKMLRETRFANVLDGYLKGTRQIGEEAIEHFHLGLAGTDWEGFVGYAASKDLTGEDLERAGLASMSKRGTYVDRFRQRLMFPILNLSQNPIAFGGRTLTKGEPAKYVNSPETPVYRKGSVLYGLNWARQPIREAGYAYVVEGYFDVISLWQAGIRNVVASSGTAFTPQQARLLARFCDQVYLFFDADSAGQQAALRSVDALFDAGLEVQVVTAPSGEDPDSIAREGGTDAIEELRGQALGFIPFRVRGVELEELGIIGREKLIKELAAVGSKIGDATRRRLFLDEAATALEVDSDLLHRNVKASGSKTTSPPRGDLRAGHEQRLLSLLLTNPDSTPAVLERVSPDDLDSRKLARVYAAIVNQYNHLGRIDIGALTTSAQDEDFVSLITSLAAEDWPGDVIETALAEVTERVLKEKERRIRRRLKEELAEAEKAGDTERQERLMREINAYAKQDE